MVSFNGDFETAVSQAELWNYFTDPEILADCAPGLQELEVVSPSELTAVLSVGVGSVKPTFDVEVTVTETDHPNRLEMKAGGEASRNAFEGVATMTLVEIDEGTRLEWEATANVSGLIASLGQRALGSVTQRLATTFFENIEAKARDGEPAESVLEGKDDAKATLDE
jgi:carbon monoxide dehydrogenase subunit G